MFELVVFDLDGTLVDSKVDLALAVNAARGDAGMGPLRPELIYTYVGNGAPTLIRRSLGPEASPEQADRALEFFYTYYRDHMLDHTTLYPGVRETLDALVDANRALAVLTNKPVRFSTLMIERLGLAPHFFRVYGGNSFDTKKPDPEGLLLLMEETGVSKKRTLMVGDSAVDVLTARNAGAVSCGVTYGLQPETLIEYPPEILLDEISKLVPVVTNGTSASAG